MDPVNINASAVACKLGLEAQELFMQTGATLERITRITTGLQQNFQRRLNSIQHLQALLSRDAVQQHEGVVTQTHNAIDEARTLVRFATIAVGEIRTLIGIGGIDKTLHEGQLSGKTLTLSSTMQKLLEKSTALEALVAKTVPHRDLFAMKQSMQTIRTAAEGNVSIACVTAEAVEQLQFQVTEILQLAESITGSIY